VLANFVLFLITFVYANCQEKRKKKKKKWCFNIRNQSFSFLLKKIIFSFDWSKFSIFFFFFFSEDKNFLS